MFLSSLFSLFQGMNLFVRMTPYQKCPRITTFLCRILFCFFCSGTVLAGEGTRLLAAPRQESRAPQSLFQSVSTDASHLFLQPALETSLDLLTHTLDVRVATNDDRSLTLQIEAAYRLHNRERQALTAILIIVQPTDGNAVRYAGAASGGNTEFGRPLPQNIALFVDGQPLALQSVGESVGQGVQVTFAADARRRLILRYELPLAATRLFNFRYPISALRSWPTDPNSWRVTIDFADTAQWLARSDSWLQVAPSDWSMRASHLQWLSEKRLPTQDILFQAIHPQRMQEIRAIREAIRAYNEPESLQWLGALYTQLYQTPDVGAAAHERLYTQALAAYAQALRLGAERGQGVSDAFLAAVRYQLAALYRMRAIAPDGSVDSTYVALMLAEAEQALPALPQGPTRQELQHWLAQGLRQQLLEARFQEDWPQALLLVGRLARLPADVVDQASLEEERRALLLQEALQQLRRGNEEAAVSLIGEEVVAGDMLPRPEYQALFANWQITVTVKLFQKTVSIDALARPIFQRRVESERALNTLLNRWWTSGVADAILTEEANGFRIRLDGVDAGARLLLIENTPQLSDWELLRGVFLAAEPDIQQEAHLLWQRTTQAIDVDFRAVGDQWHSVAAMLEREATAMVDADASNTADTTALEIRRSLRSAQHRLEAARWRRLVSDSAVQVVIEESSEAASPLRVWLLGLTDAPQRLSAQIESVSAARLWLAIALGIVLISLFAGVLWLLL